LPPDFLAELERKFVDDPKLGIAGAYLQAPDKSGVLHRQRCPRQHVEGENTFYRRECYERVAPLPPILGWDTIDELRARMHGWRTESFEVPSGDPIHLRRMGSYDGLLRGYRRAGLCAYSYGAHPLYTGLAGLSRMADRPYLLCGANYLVGWLGAAVRRVPRAEPEVRRFARHENISTLKRRALGLTLR
jgi:biofilm PGA synthesis N-glycosyltransferase PgaC